MGAGMASGHLGIMAWEPQARWRGGRSAGLGRVMMVGTEGRDRSDQPREVNIFHPHATVPPCHGAIF